LDSAYGDKNNEGVAGGGGGGVCGAVV